MARPTTWRRRAAAGAWLLLLLALAPAQAQAQAQRQMVAAAHPMAAEAGMAMLRAGGTAVDAAIATQAMLGLVEPQSSGLGGGALALHWDAATRQLSAWDGREVAPAAAPPNLFLKDGQPMGFLAAAIGGRAVGVPGTMRMLEALHQAQGRLPWAELFAPAIAAAEKGFEVSPRLAALIAQEAAHLQQDREARALFLPDGKPLAAGATLRNPAYAATLRAIAEQGAEALHRGPIAAEIAAAIRAHPNPGLMTTDDLAGYAPKRREALCGPYRGVTVCGFPPPSSGGATVLQILGILSHQNLADLDPRGLDAAHLLGEAGRIAFADRNRYLADADQVPVPLRGLLDPTYLLIRAQLLDRDRALAEPRAGNPPWQAGPPPASQPPQPESGTSHVSIVDAAGDVLALTTTVEDLFGARLMVRGFFLNNELTDFSFLPEVNGRPVANRVGPGKRPRSSMSPTIVFGADGQPMLVLGSAGGSRIIGHVAQTLVAVLDWGMEPQAAVSLPRVGALNAGLELEAGTAAAGLAPALEARGFPVELRTMTSGLHVIRILRGPEGVRLQGGADPRREGVALAD
ncbi:gamma-glutamyltransferase [Siccirubricoccus sp. KC 17139]|uniref:Glutathione hydrolase proenzyme n=1 Tax=Siccirubricoccus soli TaxID=2899147 RepID=A0ABT1D3G9_9PROT|nr:gamma-glutamyltransferase [Siccirubricoccus soli]MCO6416434.1 gamma-glutamyltransferase [Siccirubricoccus soli]MCP2682568.1 gamma-glutamyltransferase [Siccirubricoccus soli]